MLSKLFAKLLNLSLKYTSVDSTMIEGKSFGFDILELSEPIGVLFCQGQFVEYDYESVDVKISGDLAALLSMLNKESSIENEALFIEGKIASAKHFQHFLTQLSINWEGFFKKFIPNQFCEAGNNSLSDRLVFIREMAIEAEKSLLRYLSVDRRCLILKDEFDEFTAKLSQASCRIDRMIDAMSGK